MISKGDRVKHPVKADWGLGQILTEPVDNKVKIFFVNGGERTLDLRVAQLVKVTGQAAAHAVLDNLSNAKPNRKKQQTKKKPQKQVLMFDDAKAIFLRIYPLGFEDTDYAETERDYKVEAHELIVDLLGDKIFKALLKKGEYSEICKRSLQVVNKTNLIFPNEKMALKDGLALGHNKKRFAETLYELLYGKGEVDQRFTPFADLLMAIGAARWTIVTYFLFFRYPKEHMFLKPIITKNAAELNGIELNYQSTLNWLTYHSLLKFANDMRSKLNNAGLKPRDMIDVQSFIWCIAQ